MVFGVRTVPTLLSKPAVSAASGAGSFPTVDSGNSIGTIINSNSDPQTVNIGSPTSGVLCILFCFIGYQASDSTFSDGTNSWSRLGSDFYNPIFYRECDGTEGATGSLNVPSSVYHVSHCYHIENFYAGQAPEIVETGIGSVDPDPITPTWGNKKSLVIAGMGSRRSDWEPITTYPYADNQINVMNANSSATTRFGIGLCTAEVDTFAENPAAYAVTTAGNLNHQRAATIAIRGSGT